MDSSNTPELFGERIGGECRDLVWFNGELVAGGNFNDSIGINRIGTLVRFTDDVGTGYVSLETNGVSLFPNPVTDILNIEMEDQENVELYDLSGKFLESRSGKYVQFNLEGYPSGMYILRSDSWARKMVKE